MIVVLTKPTAPRCYKTCSLLLILSVIFIKSHAFSIPPRSSLFNYFNNNGDDDDSNNPSAYLHLSTLPLLLSSSAIKKKLKNPLSRFLQPKEKKQHPPPQRITSIILPNTTIIPLSTIQQAATRSQLLGSTQPQKSIPAFAELIRRWYKRNGYVLHSVAGANISSDGKCTIQLREPMVSNSDPLKLTIAKEMILEGDGSVISFSKFRRREKKLKRVGGGPAVKKEDLNTTFLEISGRSRPNEKWCRGLGLRPGRAFRWSEEKWRRCMVNSGIFKRILQAQPVTLDDGTVQLQVIAEENPARNLEYGVVSSPFTGAWEGEIDFQHRNLLGSGENVAVTLRRGTKDPEPSFSIKYQDDNFGQTGGYELSIFNDFIGTTTTTDDESSKATTSNDDDDDDIDDEDEPLLRRGITLQLPHLTYFRKSAATLGMERVSTRKGRKENILTGKLAVGPYTKVFNDDTSSRGSWRMTIDTGGRHKEDVVEEEEDGLVLPVYAGVTGTVRHVIPLAAGEDEGLTLALEHKGGTSANLPRHVGKAMGVAASVRGYGSRSNGALKTFLLGRAELRLPVRVPFLKDVADEKGICVFGDWLLADGAREGEEDDDVMGGRNEEMRRDDLIKKSGVFRKGSVGLGLRASVSGIPIKYDLCLTRDGKIGSFFGIGRDFDVY